MRTCSNCGRQEGDVEFRHEGRRCISCKYEYAKRSREGRRKWLDHIKESVACFDCGGKFPAVAMDFDHVRGEKKFPVGAQVTRNLSSIVEEIAKCELVCANCHRIRTRDRNQWSNELLARQAAGEKE